MLPAGKGIDDQLPIERTVKLEESQLAALTGWLEVSGREASGSIEIAELRNES